MITGAAVATINRLPVLLLPGDIFARRNVAPVLQQLESARRQDISVNDCFKPVCRYWDRINRPEQLLTALPEAMRVLTSPAETGAVTLALPQDVQTEAYRLPGRLLPQARLAHRRATGPTAPRCEQAAQWIRASATPADRRRRRRDLHRGDRGAAPASSRQTGIPVGETKAGKGSLRYDHPLNLGAIGVTGTLAANRLAATPTW